MSSGSKKPSSGPTVPTVDLTSDKKSKLKQMRLPFMRIDKEENMQAVAKENEKAKKAKKEAEEARKEKERREKEAEKAKEEKAKAAKEAAKAKEESKKRKLSEETKNNVVGKPAKIEKIEKTEKVDKVEKIEKIEKLPFKSHSPQVLM